MPTVKNLKFEITDPTNKWVEVVGLKNYNVETVIIPSSITIGGKEYKVTSIGEDAFRCCENLTSITIPSTVTSIGDGAFASCYSLSSIAIPSSVTSFGEWAFSCCENLTSITIPSSVTSFGEWAFNGCSSLTSITIPSSVTSIGENAFRFCESLTQIKVDSGNPVYDSRDNCNAIIETKSNTLIAGCASTIIPNSVTSIGNQAFWGCKSLTSITIPSSVTSIGDMAFCCCSSLTSITIPTHITNIDELDIPEETRIIRENV